MASLGARHRAPRCDLSDHCRRLDAAGPDARAIHVPAPSTAHQLVLAASVLHMRGTRAAGQPLVHADGHVLVWNGEVFGGLELDDQASDTHAMMDAMVAAAAEQLDNERALVRVLTSVQGPFAFIFYDHRAKRLWYGRDPLGRRSLLVRWHDGGVELASVAPLQDTELWQEVATCGVFCLDLAHPGTLNSSAAMCHAWDTCDPTSTSLSWTRIMHQAPSNDTFLAPVQVIETFLRDGTEDHAQLDVLCKHAQALLHALNEATRLRVTLLPRSPSSLDLPVQELPARIALLFSGGLDCSVLAALAHRHIPRGEPIDLLNVAFASNRPQSSDSMSWDVPDRVTGVAAYRELQALYPERPWRFVAINVSLDEYEQHRDHVLRLMRPSCTAMDLSIAVAFWFAARGQGKVLDTGSAYTTRARVLLLGTGADELLGGYSRHRGAFDAGGWPRLVAEIQVDIDRLPSRNLGRDDRVMADHGRETRLPYLARQVQACLAQVPVWYKCDGRARRGVGEKLLLRVVARQLGFSGDEGGVVTRPKRAVQFGARSARLDEAMATAKDIPRRRTRGDDAVRAQECGTPCI